MTLAELTALETAYHVLQPLDDTARRRALQWLSDALSQNQPLVASAAAAAAAVTPEPVATVSANRARPRRRAVPAPTTSAKKVKSAMHNGAGGKRGAQSSGGERAYRRMPDPVTVMKAYDRVGTISALAEHFDVPHHTVTHWARRLRAQGYQIGRSS
jgi:hypothetical protein